MRFVYYAESQYSRSCVETAAHLEQSIFRDKMLLQLFAWNSSSTIFSVSILSAVFSYIPLF